MDKGKVSIIVPSRNELFLNQTVDDLFNKAQGEIEVIVILEGYWPNPPLKDRNNLIIIHRGKSMGMRAAINSGAAIAKGQYLMKCDAHCMFCEGYDEILKADMQDNWVTMLGRHSLDAENWVIEQNGKSRRDYHYLCFPDPNKPHDLGMHGVEWPQRDRTRRDKPEYEIDDTMSCQGSLWCMTKSWFDNFLHGLNEHGYGSFSQEFQEIGNSTWLGGGEVKVNKKGYYCHLHKGKKFGRMYHANMSEIIDGHNYSAWFWSTNQWKNRIHDLEWLIEKFSPVPGWPLNWKKQIEDFWPNYGKEHNYV